MPFDWAKYLEVANFLARSHDALDREAAIRSAVSRAYYSAYHQALNFVVARYGFKPSGEADDHGKVHAQLKTRRANTARALQTLRDNRNDCDYSDEPFVHLDELFNDSLKDAQFVLDDLKLGGS